MKSLSNNPNLIEFKQEPKQQHKQSEEEIKMLEETSFGYLIDYNYQFVFKTEPIDNNNERINQLESENKSLKFKINDLNEILQPKSNEIIDLKLRLNKYETNQNDDETSKNYKSKQTIFNIESESNQDMSSCESDTDSDQGNDETSNKVINLI